MARQVIDLTTVQPNGKKGESAINAFTKINNMTQELYTSLGQGGVVESGSNANGFYQRFNSGLQICWVRSAVIDIATAVAGGTLYRGVYNWTYPAAFIDFGNVFVASAYSSNVDGWGGQSGPGDNTYGVLRVLCAASRTGQRVDGLAIGRWK